MAIHTIGSPLAWAGFLAFVLIMLALDLGVFHKHAHVISTREALIWSGVWFGCASLFCVGMLWFSGSARAMEFAAGYLIEKALAIDNIFVIAVIFGYFAVPAAYQHRVLFWGILGALVLRAFFIALGAALIARFHWVLYVFGALLVFTGAKLMLRPEADTDPGKRPIVRWFRRFVPMTDAYREQRFLVREGGRWLATPLLLCLVVIEVTDLIFAIDSIPAIFAVTDDPFIVFTSNILAILGLRSLYFLLSGVIDKFRFLKLGLGAVLCFVGAKMLLADVVKIPIAVSLLAIAGLVGGSIVLSLWLPPRASLPAPKPPSPSGTGSR